MKLRVTEALEPAARQMGTAIVEYWQNERAGGEP
jgi:hypothetical protein